MQEPARGPSVAAGVIVPMLQSLVSALAGGCLAAVASWLLEWPGWVIWAAVASVFAVSWTLRLGFSEQSVWCVQNPVIPEAPWQPATVRLEASESDPSGGVRRMRIVDAPIDQAKLRLFAQRVLDGESLSSIAGQAGQGDCSAGPALSLCHAATEGVILRSEAGGCCDSWPSEAQLGVSLVGTAARRAAAHRAWGRVRVGELANVR